MAFSIIFESKGEKNIPLVQKCDNIDVQLFGSHYPELKEHAAKLCARMNLKHLHQDLLHDTIHEYLSHPEKKQIQDPLQWIKFVMYSSVNKPNSTWYRKNIAHNRLHNPITQETKDEQPYLTDHYTKIYRIVSQHLNAHFDFVEQVLMRLRLQGLNNKEISEMLDISYDTICRINRETQEKLCGNVKID